MIRQRENGSKRIVKERDHNPRRRQERGWVGLVEFVDLVGERGDCYVPRGWAGEEIGEVEMGMGMEGAMVWDE